jgi:pyruvate formate lyase activating enzyme
MLKRLALRKTSLVDFPGRVASVLFSPGCNFRCPYCHNAPLIALDAFDGREGTEVGGDGSLPIAEVMDLLRTRAGRISGVVLSGGEPLLHEELPGLARDIHALGLKVKLDTNGSFPERIAAVEADYVALDLKTAPSRYGLVAPGAMGSRIAASIGAVRASGVDFEIRITCAPGVVGPEDMEEMAGLLEPGDEVVLQPFRPGGCLDPRWDGMEAYPDSAIESFGLALARRAPRTRVRGSLRTIQGRA